MKKIDKFMLPEHTNTLYEKEAISSIALTKEVANKINEIVDSINQLAQTDLEWKQVQEGTIRKGVLFMKDNLANSLNDLMNLLLENGFVDDRIKHHSVELRNEVQTLAGRLSGLLGSITVGTTSMDAEILDMRVGPDGKVYTTAGESLRNGYLYSNPGFIDSTTYQTKMPTMDFHTPGIWRMLFADGSTEIPENLPFTKWPGGVATLINLVQETGNSLYNTQILIAKRQMWYRYTGTKYQPWTKIGETEPYDHTVDYTNYTTLLPDANDAPIGIIKLLFAEGDTNIPSNLPFSEWSGVMGILFTTNTDVGGAYQFQFLMTDKGLYSRCRGNNWQPWKNLTSNSTGSGSKVLNMIPGDNLVATLKKAYAEGYGRVNVPAGNYDVLTHYETHYGDDYFTNYDGYATNDPFDRGVWLENIEIVFSPGAKVTCNYTGNNESVKKYFSAFACGNNVVIDGLKLESNNIRYGIHPDYNTGNEKTTMVLRNCDLSFYKGSDNQQAIGAGFGVHVDWLFENCIFRSVNRTHVLRIHNNVSDSAQSRAVFRNCYIVGPGYFKFTHYSTSNQKSPIIVTGCSFVNSPVVEFETSDSNVENMELFAFNNEIRT